MGRSVKKGPFCDEHLMKKVEALNAEDKKKVIKIMERGFITTEKKLPQII